MASQRIGHNLATNTFMLHLIKSFPGGASGKEFACQCKRHKRCGLDPQVQKIPWRKAWKPTPVFLPEESHGEWSLAVCGPWGCRRVRLDLTTKQQQIDLTEMMKMRQNETPALSGNSDRR